jgi:hypothetical protein
MLWMLGNDVDATVPELSRHVIVVNASPVARSDAPRRSMARELDTLVMRIAEYPEVVRVVPEAAAFDKGWIEANGNANGSEVAEGRKVMNLLGVAPGWFSMAEVPIVLGRDVALVDTTGATAVPVVIGSDLARALWGNANPIGRAIGAPQMHSMQDSNALMRVVGVYDAKAGNPKMTGTSGAGNPDDYRVYTARGSHWRSDFILARTRGLAEPVVKGLREHIRTRAPAMPIDWVQTLEEMNRDQARESLQGAGLAAGGGLVALLLASLGLYGVVSLAVPQRTREIGIRIAVGANPAGVRRMFLRSGVRLAGVAMSIGLPVTVIGFRFGQAQGVINAGANFWFVGAGISVVLMVVAGAATWGPAGRAARVDPAIALRAE